MYKVGDMARGYALPRECDKASLVLIGAAPAGDALVRTLRR